MSWTRSADLHAQMQKQWDKGAVLAQLLLLDGPALFPLRLRISGPSPSDLATRF